MTESLADRLEALNEHWKSDPTSGFGYDLMVEMGNRARLLIAALRLAEARIAWLDALEKAKQAAPSFEAAVLRINDDPMKGLLVAVDVATHAYRAERDRDAKEGAK